MKDRIDSDWIKKDLNKLSQDLNKLFQDVWFSGKMRWVKRLLGEVVLILPLHIIRQSLITLMISMILFIFGLIITPGMSLEHLNNVVSNINFNENNTEDSEGSETPTGEVDLIELWLLVVGIFGLIYTAQQIHGQRHQNKLDKASYYLDAWHGSDFKENINAIRKLKRETFDIKVRRYLCQERQEEGKEEGKDKKDKEGCPYNNTCNSKEPKLSSFECPYCDSSNLPDDFPISKIPHLQTAYWLIDQGKYKKLINEIQTIVDKRLNSKSSEEERRKIKRLLDLFEDMAQDIKWSVADERFLKDMFFHIIINYYEILATYIASLQLKYHNDLIYCNFINLAKTWEEWREPPVHPRLSPKIDDIIIKPMNEEKTQQETD